MHRKYFFEINHMEGKMYKTAGPGTTHRPLPWTGHRVNLRPQAIVKQLSRIKQHLTDIFNSKITPHIPYLSSTVQHCCCMLLPCSAALLSTVGCCLQLGDGDGGRQAQLGLDLVDLLHDLLLNVEEEVLEDLHAGLSNLLKDESGDGNHGQAPVVELLGLEDLELLLILGLEAQGVKAAAWNNALSVNASDRVGRKENVPSLSDNVTHEGKDNVTHEGKDNVTHEGKCTFPVR